MCVFSFSIFPLPFSLIPLHADSVHILLPMHYVITTIVTLFLPLYAYKSHLACINHIVDYQFTEEIEGPG